MEIIPAIDIIDGKCVRLTQGDYSRKKEYNSNPLEVAKAYEGAGIRRLHLVDLDGAKQKKIINLNVLERIASGTGLHIDFGGGVQSDRDIEAAFNAGASQVTGGSIAVKQPQLFQEWLKKYGSEKIILGADVKNGQIAVSGWEESSERELFNFLDDYQQKGVQYVICTDISKDGLLQGPSASLYQQIIKQFPDLELIASGGVAGMDDLHELKAIGCHGAIIGKAIYEGNISLQELAKFTNEEV
ncbi:1-(5-phosphoribosyl)-5-[(5-phosphoribosylamino)methylideneamino]imidazole-4-carboxamide isomerase [Nafulsella turpanensis]|uniref:1-(5-phosphoribosyl)-5-[(5- phosphoribosylamino)methylideneamino]imidazole-4- carboxamide isomerase n=1 Tax=Nafulsella turpanensis TaxID=1265690 RepID=UPI00034B73A5|nr:1-(5-phosphoribosyl)-5-[(5-phosphoribosylamino)methylideneamino]imidazole-4-carboxamide isomerase [Nafulsella turpanensis]